MKNANLFFIAAIFCCCLFSSCSLEKRRYSSGYAVEWHHANPVSEKKVVVQNKKNFIRDKISSVKSIELTKQISNDDQHERTPTYEVVSNSNLNVSKKNHRENKFINTDEDCDVITLKNGDEIKVKVTEVSADEIKYKKCGELNEQVYTLKKSLVFMIKYPNGSKDVFDEKKATQKNNKETANSESGLFGILSFASIPAFFVLGYFLGPVSIIFLITAIAFGIVGSSRKRKLRGLAIAGLTVALAILFFSILLMIQYA